MVDATRPLPTPATATPAAHRPRWGHWWRRLGGRPGAGSAEHELGYESALPWVLADTEPASPADAAGAR